MAEASAAQAKKAFDASSEMVLMPRQPRLRANRHRVALACARHCRQFDAVNTARCLSRATGSQAQKLAKDSLGLALKAPDALLDATKTAWTNTRMRAMKCAQMPTHADACTCDTRPLCTPARTLVR